MFNICSDYATAASTCSDAREGDRVAPMYPKLSSCSSKYNTRTSAVEIAQREKHHGNLCQKDSHRASNTEALLTSSMRLAMVADL